MNMFRSVRIVKLHVTQTTTKYILLQKLTRSYKCRIIMCPSERTNSARWFLVRGAALIAEA